MGVRRYRGITKWSTDDLYIYILDLFTEVIINFYASWRTTWWFNPIVQYAILQFRRHPLYFYSRTAFGKPRLWEGLQDRTALGPTFGHLVLFRLLFAVKPENEPVGNETYNKQGPRRNINCNRKRATVLRLYTPSRRRPSPSGPAAALAHRSTCSDWRRASMCWQRKRL